jgi:hypothetical protein
MPVLTRRQAFVLASAYQLRPVQVEEDAQHVLQWTSSDDAGLVREMQRRHGWSAASEYAPYYVAALRAALQLVQRNGAVYAAGPQSGPPGPL